MTKPSVLKFSRSIQVPPSQVYRAFTNATAIREWFCDVATVLAVPSGRIYLCWNNGFYTNGEFTRLENNHVVQFTWHGRKEPDSSQVRINITEEKTGSLLVIEHTGLQPAERWKDAKEYLAQLWEKGLENLSSTLEQGPDLRIVNRPMLGILIGTFDAAKAEELGVPVSEGVRLGGVIDELSAQKCGLQKDDVIVELNGSTIPDFFAIRMALEGRQAGDKVNVAFYRGSEKKSVEMELGCRKCPEIPGSCTDLANSLKEIYTDLQADLEKSFENVDENVAAFRPAEDEWNAKEILAHLIHTERDLQAHITDLFYSQERVSDGFTDNSPSRIRATVNAFLTSKQLIKAFRSSMNETLDLIGNIPEDFSSRKSSFWRLSNELLQFPDHIHEHIEQIQNNIHAAQQEKLPGTV